MTTIISLYAGPGAGKSTSAAGMFFKLKSQNFNVELVTEYVKSFAWEGRQIYSYDQIYFLGNQIRREAILYGKVDYVITDAPVLFSAYYAQYNNSTRVANGIKELVKAHYLDSGQRHKHVLLKRTKPYVQAGRFQNELEAKKIDVGLKDLLDELEFNYYTSHTSEQALDELLGKLIPGYERTCQT